jgi:cytochrome c-type biogenesis protein CcmH
MIWLWVAAAIISAGAATLMVQRAARAANAKGGEDPALAVFRRQMAELDQLADRGLLAGAEQRIVRAEAGRRLLGAARRDEGPARSAKPGVILLAAVAAPLAALGAYLAVGAPGFADQPFAQRLAQWRATSKTDPESLTPPQAAAVLRAFAAERPSDPERWRFLALAELQSGQPTEAVQALDRAIALAPARSDLWEALGMAYLARAGSDVDPDAQAAFTHAVSLSRQAASARYYLGRARIAGGDVAGGLADWRALLTDLPDADRPGLAAEIQQVTASGRLPAETPSPTQGLPQGQIQAMVDGLASRLKANPDDPGGWVRLVRAYSVLGETQARDAALAEARRRYAGRPEVLEALDAAQRPSP